MKRSDWGLYGSPENSPQGINMDVLRTKNSRIGAFSIDIQVLTDYFLNRAQVNTGRQNGFYFHSMFALPPEKR
jgi:hypothetical protein